MSILIGHASIDENGNIHSGASGDQNKKEVCTRSWYNKPWNVVLRCKDEKIAKKMVELCKQACANDKVGYDQWQRNTLYTQAKKVNFDISKITTKCECDCSSLMCICAIGAGVPEKYLYVDGNMKTTRTMRAGFKNSGKFDVLTDSKYLTSDAYLKAGDILIKEGSHTVMALEDGSKVKTTTTTTTTKPASGNTSYSGKGIGTATALGGMNVRTGASTSNSVIGSLNKGDKVEVLEITADNWYKIVWPGASVGYAYVSNRGNKYFSYVAAKKETASKPVVSEPKFSPYTGRVTASALNVREGAGTSYKIKTVVHKNELYIIVEEKNGFGKLKSGAGWVSLKYIKKV